MNKALISTKTLYSGAFFHYQLHGEPEITIATAWCQVRIYKIKFLKVLCFLEVEGFATENVPSSSRSPDNLQQPVLCIVQVFIARWFSLLPIEQAWLHYGASYETESIFSASGRSVSVFWIEYCLMPSSNKLYALSFQIDTRLGIFDISECSSTEYWNIVSKVINSLLISQVR